MMTCTILSRYAGKHMSNLRSLQNHFASKRTHSSAVKFAKSFTYRPLPAIGVKATYLTTINNSNTCLSNNISGHQWISHHGYCTDGSESIDIDIEYDKMVSLMKEDSTVVIDVREEEEIEAYGAVPKAINIPMGDLVQALELSPREYRSLYKRDPPDPDGSHLIFVCAKGFRSYAAVMLARELGFHRSSHLTGGYQHWKQCQEEDS